MRDPSSISGYLRISNLACQRNGRVLFQNLNFSLNKGNVLFVAGENGSGKTSLLRILCGFRRQEEGEIYWNKKRIGVSPDYFQDISYVGHNNGIKDDLTVEENLSLMCTLLNVSKVDTDLVLKQIGLIEQADVLTGLLSAGQKRKLALSRLLVANSVLWLLDEPFTSLDKSSVEFFEGLIKLHVNRGGLIILTSHHEVNLSDLTVRYLNLADCA